jgi:hypothetical protein
MKAISKGKFKTIVEAPKGTSQYDLEQKARQYIKGKYTIE